ncbi:MAG: DUF1559 domain-containing protein [Planctomycetaceae bacterium]|nr:DUF1559 domain-containing protein [Planctomycetaceae bacterium]MBT6485645.1 DUF1559 domain-containing protein [Planctomycetaceae bacterium]MBT6494871.1 DUF1559 domain-containing protein [Planctomycetaceae bacterium]
MQRCNSVTVNHQSLLKKVHSNRAGVSVWNVLAVIFVFGLFFALFFPACQSVRGPSRRVECLNNLKQLALATHNYAASRNGELPLLEDGTYGWPVALLPSLDANAVYRDFTAKSGASKTPIWIRAFTCPDDPNNDRQSMGLSYVANAGYGNFRVDSKTGRVTEVGTHTADIDWDGDGNIDDDDRAVSRASGVFWRSHNDGFRMTLDYIEQGDGMGQTIMFSENLNAHNWASRKTMDIAFVMGRDALGFEKQSSDDGPLQIQSKTLGAFWMNSNDGSLPGQSPVPSSSHPTLVFVAFCDGRVQTLSKNINPRIFARLMTPNGDNFGQPLLRANEF